MIRHLKPFVLAKGGLAWPDFAIMAVFTMLCLAYVLENLHFGTDGASYQLSATLASADKSSDQGRTGWRGPFQRIADFLGNPEQPQKQGDETGSVSNAP